MSLDRGNDSDDSVDLDAEAGASSDDEAGHIERIRLFLKEKLNFFSGEEEDRKVLDELTIDGVVNYIQVKNCKNIITMAGAGISTSAGIPDFRTPGTGLYDNLMKYDLPHPQAIFELDFFIRNPKPFFELAKELYPGSFKPTVCHYFIKMLDEKGLLLKHFTQNIDTLERIAGLSDEKVVEAHGTFHTGHCLICKQQYSQEWMKVRIFRDEIPKCEKCRGIVKPDIVFFGEALPNKFYSALDEFDQCDLLIILGSSLVVQPFASLIDKVKGDVPRLLINREKAGQRSGFMNMLGMGGGLDFDGKNNVRDVCWLGDCDEGCLVLADKLGWGDELRRRVKMEHYKIDLEDRRQKLYHTTKTNEKEDRSVQQQQAASKKENDSDDKKSSQQPKQLSNTEDSDSDISVNDQQRGIFTQQPAISRPQTGLSMPPPRIPTPQMDVRPLNVTTGQSPTLVGNIRPSNVLGGQTTPTPTSIVTPTPTQVGNIRPSNVAIGHTTPTPTTTPTLTPTPTQMGNIRPGNISGQDNKLNKPQTDQQSDLASGTTTLAPTTAATAAAKLGNVALLESKLSKPQTDQQGQQTETSTSKPQTGNTDQSSRN